MDNSNFVVMQGWMRTDLGLSGNELIVYAIIYGFSQDGESGFVGSRKYLADWCGCTTRTIQNTIDALTERGLISKTTHKSNGVKYCEYVANFTGSEKISLGGEKFSPNNIYINNIDNLKDIENDKQYISKRFIKPTVLEIKEYCIHRNNKVDAERFIDFYESKGWMVGKNKMKDWKAAVRTWEKNNYGNNGTNGIDWDTV